MAECKHEYLTLVPTLKMVIDPKTGETRQVYGPNLVKLDVAKLKAHVDSCLDGEKERGIEELSNEVQLNPVEETKVREALRAGKPASILLGTPRKQLYYNYYY